ncbi:MAG TPA: hypothetical protein VFG68_22965 [Fimbriiglobus sp.]|nr:hypothetical protein [Fimbriiglobus sp.]
MPDVPDSFAESADGVVLVANGINRMVRWDPYESVAVDAGVTAPATALTVAGSGSGQITGTYVAYCRFVDRYGNYSDLSPVSNTAVLAGVLNVDYTGVPVSAESKVTRRQILRNTDGQLRTFYVDVDTVDTSSTSFSSTKSDSQLSALEAVPLLDEDGNLFANSHGLPPDHKPFIAFHLTRIWAAGEVSYTEGSCEVTFGSTTVRGSGTEWTEEMAGRQLHVAGATEAYEVSAVDEANQTLTLTTTYGGTTDAFAAYAIRPFPAEQNLLYFSTAGLPESWPATNALELPEDGDRVTGLMPKDSFLYVLKSRRIYRVTAQTNPLDDGYIFLTANRGCVNDRSWVVADEVAYLLDEGGVYAFDGSGAPRNVSTPVQTFFRPNGPGARINWQAQRFFHASLSPGEECVRFFVTLAGDYLPRHALCYAYRLDKWWLEEYPVRIGCSALGRLGRPTGGWHQGSEAPVLGTFGARVLALDGATLDGVPSAAGTLSGTVTAAGVCSLTDAGAAFGTLTNTPVAIASGRGRGQVRVVVVNTATQLRLDRPWSVKPDGTSKYRIGGIHYTYQSARLRFVPSEDREGASAAVTFPPLDGQEARLTLEYDYGPAAVRGATRQGVYGRDAKGEDGTDVDLGAEQGTFVQRFDRHRERGTGGPRFVRIGFDGVSGDPAVSFGEMVLTGVV